MDDDEGAGKEGPQQKEEPQQPQPMSKNQEKKLRKQQRYAEQKRLRREQEKQAKQAKQEQRRAEGLERMQGMSEEEKAVWRQQRRAKVDARKGEAQTKKAKLRQALHEGQRIVIDLDFEDKMSEAEIKSLCQQLAYAYGENTRAAVPAHLIFTSLKGAMREHVVRQLSGFENWLATRTEADYMQHFGEQAAETLVYLTADSPNEVHELDPSKAYIIGGLVDRNRYKGLCFQKAEEQGIATAKLPIGEFIKLASSQVMTTNHVVHIMLRWLELRDWQAAFEGVIPTRKRKQGEAADGQPEEDESLPQREQQVGGASEVPGAKAVAAPGAAAAAEPQPAAAAEVPAAATPHQADNADG